MAVWKIPPGWITIGFVGDWGHLLLQVCVCEGSTHSEWIIVAIYSDMFFILSNRNLFLLYVFSAYGFLVPAVLLEYSLYKEKLFSKVYVQKNLVEYRTSKNGRIADIAACQEKRSFSQQLSDSAWLLLGFAAVTNGITSALLCKSFIPSVVYKSVIPPCPYGALVRLVLMLIVGDFFLYW